MTALTSDTSDDQCDVKATCMAQSDNSDSTERSNFVEPAPPCVSKNFCPTERYERLQLEDTLSVKLNLCLADPSTEEAFLALPPGEFLSTDVSGRTVWLNAPASSLLSCLEHYKKCKMSSPDSASKTSACLVLPRSRSWGYPLHKHLRGMHLVRQYRKGYPLLNYYNYSRESVPLKFAVDVWYDPPRPNLTDSGPSATSDVHSETPDSAVFAASARPKRRLRMQCAEKLARLNCHVLLDSGCTNVFVSAAFLKSNGLTYTVQDSMASLADGTPLPILGTCKLSLKLSAFQSQTIFYVAELDSAFDVILDDTWMIDHCTILDYESRSVVLRKGKRRTTLQTLGFPRSDAAKAAKPFMSAIQVKKALKRDMLCIYALSLLLCKVLTVLLKRG